MHTIQYHFIGKASPRFLNGQWSCLSRPGGGGVGLRSQLAPSHLHCQPLHWSRSRPSLLARLLHFLPGFHHLLKSLRLADWLLDCSDVAHICSSPWSPASLTCILLPHCSQRAGHTVRASTGWCSCRQISGQVSGQHDLILSNNFDSSDLQRSIWLLQSCFWQP